MLQKQKIDKLPQAIFVERKTDLKFPEGYEPFAEKMLVPERLSAK
jgi:hypothetical protein